MSNFFDQFDPPSATPSSGSATLDADYSFDQSHLAPPPSAANFFDQFDPPNVAPYSKNATPHAGNFFDQFDTPSAQPAGNFFDQFDSPQPYQSTSLAPAPEQADTLGTWQYRDGTVVRQAFPADKSQPWPVEKKRHPV